MWIFRDLLAGVKQNEAVIYSLASCTAETAVGCIVRPLTLSNGHVFHGLSGQFANQSGTA